MDSYDDELHRYNISISKKLVDHPNIQYSIIDVKTQEVHSDMDTDHNASTVSAWKMAVVCVPPTLKVDYSVKLLIL